MDPDEQLFGVPRLREVLAGKTDMQLEEMQKSVLEAVENFTRGARQADDLTLLLIRYRAADVTAITDTNLRASSASAAD
jgi:serine phosphatase RsbU (regulator of sigma subunit)